MFGSVHTEPVDEIVDNNQRPSDKLRQRRELPCLPNN